jgi:hypothetical protein
MQHRKRQRSLEDGLHGRMRVRIDIASESGAWERAGDRDFALGLGGDAGDLLPQRVVSQQRPGK